MTSGNDQALLYEDRGNQPYLFGAGNDYAISMSGDHDVAMGAGDDVIIVENSGQQSFISGGAGEDRIVLSGKWLSGDGEYFATDWTFASIEVEKAQEYLKLKYPDLGTTKDSFEWGNSALDRVMVATNVFDGTTIYFQSELINFSNGSVESGKFMPAIEESYDTTSGNMTLKTLYGRETNDTVSLKVDDVDTALKYIGTWLDSQTTSLVNTGDVLRGAHTLQIKAQPTNQRWFSENYTNAGFNLVDIENIRLWDGSNDVTIRVAGSSGYNSIDEAISNAERGDVIFVAETRQGDLQASNTRTGVAMDTSVTVDGGLRIAFEEGSNRVVNRTDTLTVTLSGDVIKSDSSSFLGRDSSALEVLGTANVSIYGSELNDIIIGNSGDNYIGGRTGDDLIFGGNGDDILHGASGDDTLIGGSSHRVAAAGYFAFEDLPTIDFDNDTVALNSHEGGAFRTGDRLYYEADGGSGFYVRNGNNEVEVKSGSSIYAVVRDSAEGGGTGYAVQFAASYVDAMNGKVYDLVRLGTATSQSITLFDNYTAASLPGNDYLYGGTGDDHLMAAGVMGGITGSTTVSDTLTMNGGSGDDQFTIFGNTGRINMFGGSGQDQFQISETFMDAAGVNKSARIVDFSATQDRLIAQATDSELGADGFDIESYLSMGEVSLSQLVAPPLPIVSGSGENGNYEAQSGVYTDTFVLSGFDGLLVEDLIAMHYSHAA
jgi:Ca2+-binding RTX toxin-like protein